MSLIMDGSTDVVLPFRVPAPSAWKDLQLYKLGVHGVINHGLKKRFLFLHQGQFGCGPDFAISVLHIHLMMMLQDYAGSSRPHVLYLQLDNCSRENKNKYLIGYCHWLVSNKVFKYIYISFLPVGHTHEDVDQMFSGFVSGMKRVPRVYSVNEFIDGLATWYHHDEIRPSPVFLYQAWNFKSWLTPYLRGVKNISQPHCFQLVHEADEVKLYTKDYHSSSSPWQGPYSFINLSPQSVPLPLQPSLLDDSVLQETFQALNVVVNDSSSFQQQYQLLLRNFVSPPASELIHDGFSWVYNYHLHYESTSDHDALAHSRDARLRLTGRSSLEQTPVLPDIDAVVAVAGDDGGYWLGVTKRLTRTTAILHWLEMDVEGTHHYRLSNLPVDRVPLSSILHPDVSLGVDGILRPALHQKLLQLRRNWNEAEQSE